MSICKISKKISRNFYYEDWWKKISNHIGAIYPFYDIEDPEKFSLNIEDIIKRRRDRGKSVDLDPVALACKVCLPYILGNRTLVRGIRRAPWVCHYNSDHNFTAAYLPVHGHKRPDPEVYVQIIKKALIDEASSYIDGAKKVGILLSGGMDSRVVAGVIRSLQISSGKPGAVVAITWGDAGSRDVVYARIIAERFNWEVQHIPLNANVLAENIDISGRMGAEVSPLHLHGISKVATLHGVEVVVAGSYGDSVGRAEFSGRRVHQLRPILSKKLNRFGLLRSAVLDEVSPLLLEDVSASPHLKSEINLLRRCEIEQEFHYMRRMLQSCMGIIAKNKRFYQLFTSPSVVGLMWGLDSQLRDDSWYQRLLSILPGDLLSIPWSRTGMLYLQKTGNPGELYKNFHSYGSWLRNDLYDIVVDRVNSKNIRNLGIFNNYALDYALKIWSLSKTNTVNSLDETMSWLSSLFVFIEKNEISIKDRFDNNLIDCFNIISGGFNSTAYILLRNIFRV